MKRVLYLIWSACLILGLYACEEDRDFEEFVSSTDDYTSEAGGDYYTGGGIDVSMYNQARVFPGLVDTLKEERLDEATIELDMKRRYVSASALGLTQVASPIYSTGLYAGAGEKITIQMDADVKGLSVQIGIHQRNLKTLVDAGSYVERAPLIVTSIPLFKGLNEIRNPYGGYIWIRRSGNDGENLGTLPLLIHGAYKAPDYIQGETTQNTAEWIAKIKETTVPWIELRGRNVAFSVPVDYMKQKVQNADFVLKMDRALSLWDESIDYIYQFYGMDGTDERYPVSGYPIRAVMDIHLITERYSFFGSYSGTENNDAIELLKTEEMIDMLTSPESIEMGTNSAVNLLAWIQKGFFSQPRDVLSEAPSGFTWAYSLLPGLYFQYQNKWARQNFVLQEYKINGGSNKNMAAKSTSITLKQEDYQKLTDFASADSCKLFNPNATMVAGVNNAAVAFLTQIMGYQQDNGEKTGWKFYGYLNRCMFSGDNPIVLYSTGMNRLLYALTDYFERDFSALFDRWGVEVSDAARLYAMKKYPVEKQIWQYNVLEDNGTSLESFDGSAFYTKSGKVPFRHQRTDWVAVAYGKGDGYAGENGDEEQQVAGWTFRNYKSDKMLPSNLFDGNRTTFWESYSDTYVTYTDKNGIVHEAYKGDKLYYVAKTPEFGYHIIIDPEAALKVNGFYLANGNTSGQKFLYETDSEKWDYSPKHIIVEFTQDQLDYDGEKFNGVVGEHPTVNWVEVYDSNKDSDNQFIPHRMNLHYIDLDREYTGVRGIRITFDKETHEAKDKPADWDEEKYPNRPDKANDYLDRIHKLAEFGTYYYLND